MKYFIFNFETDKHLVDSFLEGASLAYGHEKVKTEEWFFWKFHDNPYGETILACAEKEGKIVGCVAYGIQPFWLNRKIIKGVLSFDTFVHPSYQGKGIFSKLIKLGEETAKSKNIDFMLNFPNSNSLRGFVKSGWNKIDSPEYWIKGKNIFTIPTGLKDLRKGFLPNKSNLSLLSMSDDFSQLPNTQLTSVINSDYLKWRFFTFPVTEYAIIENDNIYSIIRMGTRGNLREGQVLFINNNNNNTPFRMSDFIKLCMEKAKYDILSFSVSKSNPVRKSLIMNLFIKVPNKTNICYKILNKNTISSENIENMSLNAINYHTY